MRSKSFQRSILRLRVVALEHYAKNLMRIIPTKGEKQ